MDEEDVAHIYNGILLSHKKEWNFAICNDMDGLGGYYAYWNKPDWERQILYDIPYMCDLKSKTSEYNKKETDTWIQRTNECLPVGRGKEGGRGKIGIGD